MNNITLSLIPVLDMSTTDETVKAVKKANAKQVEYGAGSAGAEYVRFVAVSRLGWSYQACKDEGVLGTNTSESHHSKGNLLAGIASFIATGNVPEMFDTDERDRRAKFNQAVDLVKAYW